MKRSDKAAFITQGDKVLSENSSKIAIREARKSFEGLAEELGLKNEQDVVKLVREVRQGLREKKNAANND